MKTIPKLLAAALFLSVAVSVVAGVHYAGPISVVGEYRYRMPPI